jgi:hypothetical protein
MTVTTMMAMLMLLLLLVMISFPAYHCARSPSYY